MEYFECKIKRRYPNVLISTFKLFNKFSRFHHSRKTYYYEKLKFKYSNLQSYVELLTDIKEKKVKVTNQNIGLSDYKLFAEINPEYILRKYGKPNYIIDQNKKSLGLEIYFYKQVIGRHKAKFEVHFFENCMFFYNYTFSYLNQNDRNEMIQLIKDKYQIGSQLDISKDIVLSKKKSVISFAENIDLTVNYFDSIAVFFENLDDLLEKLNDSENYRKKVSKSKLYARL